MIIIIITIIIIIIIIIIMETLFAYQCSYRTLTTYRQ